MSKNKNRGATAPATVATTVAATSEVANTNQPQAVSLATLTAKETELKAQLAAIETQRSEAISAETARINGLVNAMPASVGLTTLDELTALIKRIQNPGKTNTGAARTYTVLSAERRTELVARLKAGGANNQISVLATEFGVSPSTVWGIKKDEGLTATRAATAPATPAVVVASSADEAVALAANSPEANKAS